MVPYPDTAANSIPFALILTVTERRTAIFLSGRSVRTKWSGRRESNPRMQLGKLPFYH